MTHFSSQYEKKRCLPPLRAVAVPLAHTLLYLFSCALAVAQMGQSGVAQSDQRPGVAPQQTIERNLRTKSASVHARGMQSGIFIDAGDLLEINVFSIVGAPEVNSKARVSTSGGVSVPLLGNVQVAGLTSEEAEATIEARFRDEQILKQPHVTVFVSEYANQGVSVLGEVSKPGVYPVLVSRRLLDLISEAGGLTPTAGKIITITHRTAPQEPKSVAISRDPNQSFADNVEVFPGDTIVVAKAGVIYVVGAVGKPGGFTIGTNEGLTVLQAIALAEGSKPDAALDKSKLIRKTPAGPEEIPIPISKILASKVPDLQLRPDDIVFVPSSAAKGAARRSLEAIVQTATGVIIYRR